MHFKTFDQYINSQYEGRSMIVLLCVSKRLVLPVCDICRLQTADYRLHLGLNSTLVSLNSTQVSLNSTQVNLFTVSYW